jgi:hypothetical protein
MLTGMAAAFGINLPSVIALVLLCLFCLAKNEFDLRKGFESSLADLHPNYEADAKKAMTIGPIRTCPKRTHNKQKKAVEK